jgi:hypothetical protein
VSRTNVAPRRGPSARRRLRAEWFGSFAKTSFNVALLAWTFFCGSAFAVEQCRIGVADIEKEGSHMAAVVAAVRRAPNCERAYRLFESCSFGTSGDNQLDDVVQAKCAPLFMKKIDAAGKKAFEKAKKRCDRIAGKNSGTMYMSFAAVCRSGVARDFARRYSRRR